MQYKSVIAKHEVEVEKNKDKDYHVALTQQPTAAPRNDARLRQHVFSGFCFLLSALTFFSCSFNPHLQGKGKAYLQGQWQQDTSKLQHQLVTYSLYDVNFACDSFYLKINTFSKVNYGADTCMSKGHWTEYVKGNYQQRNDTLHFNGQFCDAQFQILQKANCFRGGPFREDYKLVKKTDSLLQLTGPESVVPINIRLIKRTTCQQKPI